MKILVTGAKGFIGKNLIAELRNRQYKDIYEYAKDTDPDLLHEYCKDADFVFHLAGINRPKDECEFMEGNYGFTSKLLKTLKKYNNTCPIMISSSIQANLNNPYGISKRAGEDLLFNYSKETGANVLVYRFPNVFGKWCKPNYNSAIATFCHNVANDLPITVNDPNAIINLVYIDDVIEELIQSLEGKGNFVGSLYEIPIVYTKTLGSIVELIYSFKNSREERFIPDMSDSFTKKLYSTYLSYLPKDKFSYDLKMNVDNRGSFTEFLKTPERGQVSVNISKPGITKGNHWHHTKNEKFLVVSGNGVIRFRKIGTEDIIEYFVSGDKLEVVDIPTGYTHNIENLGDKDMVTIMWANEFFDPERPDTYYLEV
ncbi:capsular polysaccharide biosynthesis protein CapF [Mesobacillus subterraneus]|uniref:Capsular polysaccharide biosynthesis protein CapF n=1 Tax=Mesobacillus subterraneus TaxID=285983 RepID=A0A427TRA7_9BACI|nr:capsular polysaccharide biosynthesis protein CapF [Mesobacillus subterraneus]RSD26964.1 capsular polysaccharide biosynthesis protein CapF [Mesobacillus subterraneus]